MTDAGVIGSAGAALGPPAHFGGQVARDGQQLAECGPELLGGPDAIAAHRHSAYDCNMTRIWAQHSMGGDDKLPMR